MLCTILYVLTFSLTIIIRRFARCLSMWADLKTTFSALIMTVSISIRSHGFSTIERSSVSRRSQVIASRRRLQLCADFRNLFTNHKAGRSFWIATSYFSLQWFHDNISGYSKNVQLIFPNSSNYIWIRAVAWSSCSALRRSAI